MKALKPDNPVGLLVTVTLDTKDVIMIRKAYKMPLANNRLIVKSAFKDLAKLIEITKKHPAEIIELVEKQFINDSEKVA